MNNQDQNIGYLFNKAAKMLKGELNERLKNHDLTAAQWAVLKDLAMEEEKPEEIRDASPAAISHRLYVNRPVMTGLVDRLGKNGWIEARINPNDRRSQIITLTEQSRQVLRILENLGDETVKKALNGFDPDEVQAFRKYLQQMISNLSRQETEENTNGKREGTPDRDNR